MTKLKMAPQYTPVLHYTKQPLIPSSNQVTVLSTNGNSKKLMKSDRKKRDKNKIKCVIVGDKQVGKTSLAVSYSNDSFPSEYVPTAYDNYNVDVQVDGKPIRLEICDTAGEDNLGGPLRRLCYPGADVFMLCFSMVRPSSFKSACERWADELTRLGVPVVLVGCQADLVNDFDAITNLRRQQQTPVSSTKAREFATRMNATYVETSAKTCNNLKEAFDEAIITALIRKKQEANRKWWKKMCCWK